MTNMTKDYYKILDIPEFSTQDEIKSAYRKLARKWHPDIAGNCPDAISKFKEINEAYEILSNIIKKEEYDKARKFYNYSSVKENTRKKTTTDPNIPKETINNEKQQKQSKKTFSFDWEEIISKKRRNTEFKKFEQEKTHPIKGKDINTDIEISLEESITGTNKVINMLQTTVCPKCNGRKFVNSCLCSHCSGKGEISQHKKFTVKIPAGIKDNSKIRLAGEGEKGINCGVNGDLYLTVHIIGNKNYKTDGLNILKTVQIAPCDAILGAIIKVETPSGEVSVKIAPNTQNNQKIRLSGCGITHNGHNGDVILTIEINIPQSLSEEEINLYKQLKEIHDKIHLKY